MQPGQKDQDTLPPYEILDEILRLYVEENQSARDIVAHGFDEKTVRWVQRRVDLNEYKRAQAAPGIKVTSRALVWVGACRSRRSTSISLTNGKHLRDPFAETKAERHQPDYFLVH